VGLILYAGGIQSERALPDKHWIYNIHEQVKFVMETHGIDLKLKGTKILVETELKTTNNRCVRLSSLIASTEISREIQDQGFDVEVRPKSLYISSPEDLTLYPNNATLVETCSKQKS
jgi:hypothetical protein